MAMFTTYERYQEMLARGELKTQMTVENLIVEVSSAYYNVIVQHSKLDASKHSLELSTERYNEARDKYMLGVLSGLELQQAKIDLNADSSKYMKQKELLKSSYISLNMLMNSALEQDMYVRDCIASGVAVGRVAEQYTGTQYLSADGTQGSEDIGNGREVSPFGAIPDPGF